MDSAAELPTLRDRQKAQTRELIIDAMVEAMTSGEVDRMTHDALAKRTGISRQTVYRHFPDKEALMNALWTRMHTQVVGVLMPNTEEELLERLPELFASFDRNADLITIGQSTPQGRQMRMAAKEHRSKAFLAATSAATKGLNAEDARLATAAVQLMLGGHAWIEMRQQWDLTGEQMATAVGWAARTLLADLHARKGRPLSEA